MKQILIFIVLFSSNIFSDSIIFLDGSKYDNIKVNIKNEEVEIQFEDGRASIFQKKFVKQMNVLPVEWGNKEVKFKKVESNSNNAKIENKNSESKKMEKKQTTLNTSELNNLQVKNFFLPIIYGKSEFLAKGDGFYSLGENTKLSSYSIKPEYRLLNQKLGIQLGIEETVFYIKPKMNYFYLLTMGDALGVLLDINNAASFKLKHNGLGFGLNWHINGDKFLDPFIGIERIIGTGNNAQSAHSGFGIKVGFQINFEKYFILLQVSNLRLSISSLTEDIMLYQIGAGIRL